jgi:transcriptional regulator with XRE-family HTH domain
MLVKPVSENLHADDCRQVVPDMSTRKDSLVPDSPQVPYQDEGMPLYLKEWRQHRGLTQQQLADRIGTAKSYVSKWETKERALRDINRIKKICEVLDIGQDDLSKMPPKSGESLTRRSSADSDSVQTADLAGHTGDIEMLEKRADLHAAVEGLPDELLDTLANLIDRLKGIPRPPKRA